ncbi:hypothetical protein PAPHI01_0598 [Pancytospora philotis]|nr:hypothetical protein PAPHI01_0598 [Pancytospora philotis]
MDAPGSADGCIVCRFQRTKAARGTKRPAEAGVSKRPKTEACHCTEQRACCCTAAGLGRGEVSAEDPPAEAAHGYDRLALSISDRMVLARMGVDRFPRVVQKSIPQRVSEQFGPEFMQTYALFAKHLDLFLDTGSLSMPTLEAFAAVLCRSYRDEATDALVDALSKKGPESCKSAQADLLHLHILVYAHCLRHGLDAKLFRNRIIEAGYLFKPCRRFPLAWADDSFINKYIVHMRGVSGDADEALFLNQLYLAGPHDKQLLQAFAERLPEALALVHDEHVFSFLLHVFAHQTVMFAYLNEAQLYQLIVTYYKNSHKPEHLAILLDCLADRLDSTEIGAAIASEFSELKLTAQKYAKLQNAMQIRGLTSIGGYEGYFVEHADSFNAVAYGFDELARLQRLAKPYGRECEIVGALCALYRVIKPAFLARFIKALNKMLIEALGAVGAGSEAFPMLNKACWDTLSEVVLTTQRLGVEDCDMKSKKARGGVRLSELSKQASALVAVITGIEEKAAALGIIDLVRLKSRGFKIS